MEFGWDDDSLQMIDTYILGYSTFRTQQELADFLGKSLNAIKIKLSRRNKEIKEFGIVRTLSSEEYITFLSNRFDKTTMAIASLLHMTETFLLEQLDESDNLECKEYLEEGFATRPVTNEEYEIFIKLYSKNRSVEYISHILNRKPAYIQEMIKEYERI